MKKEMYDTHSGSLTWGVGVTSAGTSIGTTCDVSSSQKFCSQPGCSVCFTPSFCLPDWKSWNPDSVQMSLGMWKTKSRRQLEMVPDSSHKLRPQGLPLLAEVTNIEKSSVSSKGRGPGPFLTVRMTTWSEVTPKGHILFLCFPLTFVKKHQCRIGTGQVFAHFWRVWYMHGLFGVYLIMGLWGEPQPTAASLLHLNLMMDGKTTTWKSCWEPPPTPFFRGGGVRVSHTITMAEKCSNESRYWWIEASAMTPTYPL